MAFWQKKEPTFEEMYVVIERNPGQTPSDLARIFNVPPSTITRRLPGMAEAGYLPYEDDKGKLFPFKKKD